MPIATRTILAWAVLSLAIWPAAGQRSDPFYSGLLEEGIRSYERGDHARAGEDLRIASFGLLESPEELARSLAYLALAQSAGGNQTGFERSYERLEDLESRFGALSAAALADSVRSDLAAAAAAAGLVEAAQVETPVAVDPAGANAEPTVVVSKPELCISWSGDDDCRKVPKAPADSPTESQIVAAPGAEELEAFERLDRLASDKANDKQLRWAFEEASALADRYPDWVEMQRVAAVLASRRGSFAESLDYYERAGEQAGNGPVQLFYLSVALFETNQPEAAASVLRQALPALEQNREVRKYVRRILPEESTG